MAASNIVLADAQATPVNHTFIPLGPDSNGVFWFEDQSQLNPIGFWRISYQLKRPPPGRTAGLNSSQRMYRAVIGLHEPVLEALSNQFNGLGLQPAPTIAYIDRVVTEYVVAERATLQNRKDLRKMNYNLQNESQLVSMVELLTMPF